jgi:glycosyltransferase involved in cell wall biosynthesis
MHIVMMGCKGIPATYGGVERAVEELSIRLARHGHRVTVLCRNHYTPKMTRYENVEIVRLPTIRQKHLEMIVHTLLSALYVAVKRCDLVHIHSVEPAVVAPFVRLFHPVVATSHGQTYRRDKWGRVFRRLSRTAERIFISTPCKCTAVSRTLTAYYVRRYGKAVEFIPNGVTLQEPAGPEHLKQFGLDKDGYILFVGRLLATKGPQLLIDAYKKVRPNLKLVIAGGSSHTDRYEKMLKKEASEDIIFVGFQYGECLRALYSNCRLFVFPSYIEGLPLVLLEALSFLRPVVFSDIPENLEIADGLGVPFQCGSVDDLAGKLRDALSNTDRLAALRPATLERLSREFNWDRVADQYLQAYQEVMAACGIDSVAAQQPSAPP